MPTNIRLATARDVPAWAAMRHKLWPHAALKKLTEELPSLLRRTRFRGWIAIDQGQPVGFAEASVRNFSNGCDTQPVAFLEGIWVGPRHRKKGVGRRLVAAVERWARGRGLKELGSDAALRNRPSHRSHKTWGFEETERVVYFRKRLRRG